MTNLNRFVHVFIIGLFVATIFVQQLLISDYSSGSSKSLAHHPIDESLSAKDRHEMERSSTEGIVSRNLISNLNFKDEATQKLPIKLDFREALAEINKMANLIYQRFEYHHPTRSQFFWSSANMPIYGWDLIKYKIAQKILLFAMINPANSKLGSDKDAFDIASLSKSFNFSISPENTTYLMVFGGSSVTAGHDNYYHQSYPFVFERRMEKAFRMLGLKLFVRNIAQGSNNCRPSGHCYLAQGGEHPDFVSWEQSFNCGRDKGVMEYIARVAYWNEAVVYYSASGAFLPNSCAETTDKLPWTSEEWTPESVGITDKYELSPTITSELRSKLGNWYDDGNSVSRFTNQVYGGLYKGTGPHGYSVWAHSSKLCNNGTGCDAMNVKGDCLANGGPHWMIAETAYYAGEKGKHGKSWHPSAGMHLLRGEVLAYNFLHILADAIYMIEEDLEKNKLSKEDAFLKYRKEYLQLRYPIPERPLHLSMAEAEYQAQCYTDYEPHFNPKNLLEKIIIGNTSESGWVYTVKHHDYSGEAAKYGYQDRRPCYEAKGSGAEIHFKIENVRSGEVRICGYSQKESLAKAELYFDVNYTLPAGTPLKDVKYEASPNRFKITSRKYAGDECTRLWDIPGGGPHVLTVRTHPEHPHHISSLSHVVIF